MALKARMANKLKIDDDGYVTGIITDIQFIDSNESEYEREQFCFFVECDGTKKSIVLRHWTGTVINGDKVSNNNDYNKLTRFLLQLKVISETELEKAYKSGEDLMVDIESLKGTKIRFKPVKSAKLRGLSQLDPMTLEPVETTTENTKKNVQNNERGASFNVAV